MSGLSLQDSLFDHLIQLPPYLPPSIIRSKRLLGKFCINTSPTIATTPSQKQFADAILAFMREIQSRRNRTKFRDKVS